MKRTDGLRAAIVVHLFHEDVAIELLRQLAELGADVDVIATGPPMSRVVAEAFSRLPRADFVETPNEGFDVAPFIEVLPLLERRGYDLVCKLHTKRGTSGFGRQWRRACLDALVGSAEAVAATIEAFRRRPDLAMVGPAELYLSASANMTANADGVTRLAPIIFPSLELPPDWGFFAGTMFWTRLESLRPFARLRGGAAAWEGGGTAVDGGFAHAVERLFGLIPVVAGGMVGLRPAQGGPLRLTGELGTEVEILDALARLGRPSSKPRLTDQERTLVRRSNPLVHYLAAAKPVGNPNPFFADEWYARQNALAPGTNPLSHFLGLGAAAPDPSPLFRAASYVKRRPWLRRRNENALLHHVREFDAIGDATPSDPSIGAARPHSTGTDAFSRVARRQQLAAFLGASAELSFAVKIAASRDAPSEWGDLHFANGLAAGLMAGGSEARVEHKEDWYRRTDTPDVAICLRGPTRYEPRADAFNILWVISHPDQVSFEEMEEYDLVYVASESFASLLRHWVNVPVLSLLQATDAARFAPPADPAASTRLFFAGNSRGADRPVVRWALDLALPLEIHGFGWAGTVSDAFLEGQRIANADLPGRYAAAPAVLNDHWPAMIDFGFVSNRLFDVLASGGTPITDAFPAISATLGTGPIEIAAPDELVPAVAKAIARPPAKRLAYADQVRRRHSFAVRSESIVRDLRAFPRGTVGRTAAGRGPRVHLVYDTGDSRTTWMVARRLLGPLTTDQSGIRSLSVGGPLEPVPSKADFVIAVPGSKTRTAVAWDRLLAKVGTRRIVVDAGALRRGRLPAEIAPLLAAAWQAWHPDAAEVAFPARHGKRSRLVPDSIDPRLWRDHHPKARWEDAAPPLRCVMVAEEGIDPAVAAIFEGAVAGKRVALTVVEPAPSIAGPWQSVPFPAGKSGHATFARWLRTGQFQVGLCLGASPRAVDLAFLDFSAASLLSVVPDAVLRDPEVAARALVVPIREDAVDLGAVLEALAEAPGRYAGIAAACADYVWRCRSAASVGATIKDLLRS